MGVTDRDGWIRFRSPDTDLADGEIGCAVVNILATGATYDWAANVNSAVVRRFGNVREIGAEPYFAPEEVAAGQVTRVELLVRNEGAGDAEATLEVVAPAGEMEPPRQVIRLSPSETKRVTFWWDTADVAPGDWQLLGRIAESEPTSTAIIGGRAKIDIRVTD
jgi:hypothetical protein